LSTLVADTTPGRLRATGFGIFNLVSGLTLVLASLLAGLLWDLLGAGATFIAGGGFALLTALGLLLIRPAPSRSS
jgi:MFS family permease